LQESVYGEPPVSVVVTAHSTSTPAPDQDVRPVRWRHG
jgi:hypothetical protein